MADMEFLKQNVLDTTTMLLVPAGNTGTISYLFDRNRNLGFTTVNYDSNTSAVVSIVFAAPTVLSNIFLQNHNLKQFRVYYNSVTANSLANFTTNSATSTYLSFASITVSAIDIQMDIATTTGVEKSIGEAVVAERRVQFERNPTFSDFAPVVARKKITHEMPDGGKTHYIIKDKFKAGLKWKFITTAFRAQLRTVYDDALPFYYLPFPTTTGWDGVAHEVLWDNDFDFAHDDNSKTQGFGGEIKLWETSNT